MEVEVVQIEVVSGGGGGGVQMDVELGVVDDTVTGSTGTEVVQTDEVEQGSVV